MTVGRIAPSVAVVEIPVTVFDSESQPVTITATLVTPIARREIVLESATVASSPDGLASVLRWNAAAVLPAETLQVGLTLVLQPSDQSGRGPAVVSEPFTFGNDPPTITAAAVQTIAGVAGGECTIELSVSDTGQDGVRLASMLLERDNGAESIAIPLATPDFDDPSALRFVADGNVKRVAWSSFESARLSGESVRLTLVVRDELGAESRPFTTASFLLDNAPRVTIAVSGDARATQRMGLPFSVVDPSGARERVALTLDYEVAGVWYPASAASTGHSATTDLPGDAASGVFVWDLAADAAQVTKGLVPGPDGVAYTPALNLRATATNSRGMSRQVLLSGLAVGNDAPLATLVDVPALSQGLIPLAYRLQDSARDLASVELEFRLRDETAEGDWRRCALGGGTDTDLPTDQESPGRAGVFVWNSRVSLQADQTQAQGIGQQSLSEVALRIRACDRADGVTRSCGPWSLGSIGTLRNQTPPVLSQLRLLRQPNQGGAGPFAVSFRVDDFEGDDVDVRPELSFDFGVTWLPVRELPFAESEGFYDLPSGLSHSLLLDPSGLVATPVRAVRLRLLATDGYPEEAPLITSAETLFVEPLQDLGSTAAVFFASPTWTNMSQHAATGIAVAQLAGDSRPDLFIASQQAASGPPVGGYAVQRNDGAFAFTQTTQISPMGSPVVQHPATGDLDGDGFSDVALVRGPTLSGSGPFTVVPGGLSLVFSNGAGGLSEVKIRTGVDHAHGVLVVAPVDADTVLDLVTISGASVTINYGALPAPRANIFDTAVAVELGSGVQDVAVADVDGDGLQDLVACAGAELRVARGLGARSFGAPEVYSLSHAATHLMVADLDFDGRPDVLARGATRLSVLLTSTRALDGLLGMPVVSNAGRAIDDLALRDLNDDGLLDALVLSDTLVGVMLSSGVNGGFSLPLLTELGGGVIAMVVEDFDGDGRQDVIGIGPDNDGYARRVVLPGVAVAFPASGALSAPGVADGAIEPNGNMSADFDLDGKPDLVSSPVQSRPVSIAYARNAGAFSDGTYVREELPVSTLGWDRPAAADFDRDGVLELVTTGSRGLIVTRGRFGPGMDTPAFEDSVDLGFIAATEAGAYPSQAIVADLNDDGWPDLVASAFFGSGSHPGYVVVALNTATGQAPLFEPLVAYAAGQNGESIAVEDFDSDGILDVALASGATNQVAVLRGQGSDGVGTGTFAAPSYFAVGASPRLMAACDVNGDGAFDLVIASGSNLVFLRGQFVANVVSGSFAAPAVRAAGGTIFGLDCLDLNADGYADAAVSLETGGVNLFWGDPASTPPLRAVPNSVSIGSFARHVGAGDLNRDGITDVWTSTYFDPQLLLLYGQHTSASNPLSRIVSESAGAMPRVAAAGQALTPGRDRFGLAYVAHAAQRRASTHWASPPPSFETGCGHGPGKWVPLSGRYEVAGDKRLVRLRSAGDEGEHLLFASRLGPRLAGDGQRRAGLNAEGATLSEQRVLRVDLPMFSNAAALVASDRDKVRVFVRSPDWQRDPDDLLPRVTGATGARHVVRATPRWHEICADADGDLSTGSGARFDVMPGFVRVLSDRLGELQAFGLAP